MKDWIYIEQDRKLFNVISGSEVVVTEINEWGEPWGTGHAAAVVAKSRIAASDGEGLPYVRNDAILFEGDVLECVSYMVDTIVPHFEPLILGKRYGSKCEMPETKETQVTVSDCDELPF